MTVIVEAEASLVEAFISVVGAESTVFDSIDEAETHLRISPQEYAVVLGPSVAADMATAFAARTRIDRPTLGVVLVRDRIDSEVLAAALRGGMRDVVETDDLKRLGEAVRVSHDVWQAMSAGRSTISVVDEVAGRLVTVFSTKGGVGKSTIATNVAAALVSQKHRVCLVDLDIQNGDVAIMLQLFPNRTLADLHNMGGAVDADAVESLLTTHACGLSVLVAPVQVDSMPVSPDAVGRVLEHLKKTFDFVVVDTSGAFDDYALSAIDHSDVLLLVGTLDIPALKSLKVATDTLDLLNVPRAQWQLVLNRADAKVGLSPSEFEKALDLAINASIPSSLDVPASINRGECIVLANPRHAVSHTINALAASLAAHKSSAKDDAEPRGAHADNSRRGLLRRKVR